MDDYYKYTDTIYIYIYIYPREKQSSFENNFLSHIFNIIS